MSPSRHTFQLDGTIRERRASASELSWVVRLLRGIGAHPAFAESVLGDLTEERARRTEEQGAYAARLWYLREALRSAPHLAWNAVRHGGARGRMRVMALAAAVALVPAVALLVLTGRDEVPARLAMEPQGTRGAEDGIVLNSVHAVQLFMHVFNAKDQPLPPLGVQYRWVSGTPLYVSPQGAVTCRDEGDATIRATAGRAATTVFVRCRPVREVRARKWIQLVAGGPGEGLLFFALAPDGHVEDRLAGELRVRDTSIAVVNDGLVIPRKAGHTAVTIDVGDAQGVTEVSVYEPVPSLAGLRPEQRLAAAPVHLARGDTIRWPLPTGTFWLQYLPAGETDPLPSFMLEGNIHCTHRLGAGTNHVKCLVRRPGASVLVTHPRGIAGVITGVITGMLGIEMTEE